MVWICIPTPRPSKICPQTRKSRTKISHSVLGVDLFVFVMPLNIQEDLLLCNNRKKCQSAHADLASRGFAAFCKLHSKIKNCIVYSCICVCICICAPPTSLTGRLLMCSADWTHKIRRHLTQALVLVQKKT